MDLKIEALHKKALVIAQSFHKSESDLIDILQEIDESKVFVHLGFSSLFDYAVKALKLSEANASNFITVARKSKIVPELKEAIRAQEITVSKARKITPVLTPENSAHWLDLAKNLPRPKLEREVARILPQSLTPEKAKYVSENRLELKMGISEALMKKLKRAQDLESQKNKKSATLEDVLEATLSYYLDRTDPLEKARRSLNRASAGVSGESKNLGENLAANTGNTANTAALKFSILTLPDEHTGRRQPLNAPASVHGHTSHRQPITAQLKHQIQLRDNGQCTHRTSTGERCDQKRWLDIHHLMPVSKGGKNEFHNLRLLCHAHHRQTHL